MGAIRHFVTPRDNLSHLVDRSVSGESAFRPFGRLVSSHRGWNLEYSSLEISITRQSVLFNAGEVTGNIWAAEILDVK